VTVRQKSSTEKGEDQDAIESAAARFRVPDLLRSSVGAKMKSLSHDNERLRKALRLTSDLIDEAREILLAASRETRRGMRLPLVSEPIGKRPRLHTKKAMLVTPVGQAGRLGPVEDKWVPRAGCGEFVWDKAIGSKAIPGGDDVTPSGLRC